MSYSSFLCASCASLCILTGLQASDLAWSDSDDGKVDTRRGVEQKARPEPAKPIDILDEHGSPVLPRARESGIMGDVSGSFKSESFLASMMARQENEAREDRDFGAGAMSLRPHSAGQLSGVVTNMSKGGPQKVEHSEGSDLELDSDEEGDPFTLSKRFEAGGAYKEPEWRGGKPVDVSCLALGGSDGSGSWGVSDEDDGESTDELGSSGGADVIPVNRAAVIALGLNASVPFCPFDQFCSNPTIDERQVIGVASGAGLTLRSMTKKAIAAAHWLTLMNYAPLSFGDNDASSMFLVHRVGHISMMAALDLPFTKSGFSFYETFVNRVMPSLINGSGVNKSDMTDLVSAISREHDDVVRVPSDFVEAYNRLIGDDVRLDHKQIFERLVARVEGIDHPVFGVNVDTSSLLAAYRYLEGIMINSLNLRLDHGQLAIIPDDEDHGALFPSHEGRGARFDD